MPFLDLATHRVFYNDTGDGPPLVLLHNGFYSSQTWDRVRSLLTTTFRVIDYDQRGYGQSSRVDALPEGYDNISAGAEELDALVEKLELGRIRLLGHCFGGAIAVRFATRHPQKVEKLVVEATGFYSNLKSTIASDMTFVSFGELPEAFRDRLVAMHGDEYAPHLWSVLCSYRTSYIMSSDYDLRDELYGIKVPLLIANGDHDFFFEPAHPASVFSKLRKTARLWIAPGIGHDMHEEAPELFARVVGEFLA